MRALAARPDDARLRLCVVIPTFRRPELVLRCLEAVVAQSLEPAAFEVIVVDDGRTDDTQAAVEAFAQGHAATHRIRYVRPEHGRGPAAARNRGWRLSGAKIIAFTDDDTIPDAAWLVEGERALGSELAAVAGRVWVPLRSGSASGGARPTDHELMTLGLERAEFVTANAFVRRSALDAVGGFDERFERAWREDSDLQFSLLAGSGRIARCPRAVVAHPVRAERWGVSLRQQKNVFYDALLYKKHPRLYRERILPAPPWDYYLTVALSIAAAVFWSVDNAASALMSVAIVVFLVGSLAWRRLRKTSRAPAHVAEMIVTSVAIPFLSVYWRLRGALHFRVPYL